MAIGLTDSICRFQDVLPLLVRHGLYFSFSILRKLIELVFLPTFTHTHREICVQNPHTLVKCKLDLGYEVNATCIQHAYVKPRFCD